MDLELTQHKLFDDQQQFLLNCCLTNSPEIFRINWRKWKKTQDFDELTYESLLLIPTLYKQIERFKVEDQNKGRYKGIYKKSWVKTIQLTQSLLPILVELKEKDLSYWIVGNIALEEVYYEEIGILKTSCVEILVQQEDSKAVIDFLFRKGFCSKDEKSDYKFLLTKLKYGKPIQLIDNQGSIISISLGGFPFITVKSCYHENQLEFRWNDIQFNTLLHEFELIRIIINSFFEKSKTHLQWILDAKIILEKKKNDFDWEYFYLLSERFEISFLVGKRLQILVINEVLEIPLSILDRLLGRKSAYNFHLYQYRFSKNKLQTIKFNRLIYNKMKFHQTINWIDYCKVLYTEDSLLIIMSRIIKKNLIASSNQNRSFS